jgi:spermidine synthase
MAPVKASYEELDHRTTPLGELVLRRRRLPGRDEPVYEITLGGAFLMSSLVHRSEVALAELALEARGPGAWSVLVGGLGLGYTARAALAAPAVREVVVVELLPQVVDWHERGLLPLKRELVESPRCRILLDDFYALVTAAGDPWDLILVDIDHSPEALLHHAHAHFYTAEGLARVRRRLAPGGIFGLWTGFGPEGAFLARLREAFDEAWVEEVWFHNPSVDGEDVNAIYLARRADRG